MRRPWLAAAAAVAIVGCGEVVSSTDAPVGQDGPFDHDALGIDGPPGVDAACAATVCRAVDDPNTGGQGPMGTAACVADTDICPTAYSYLDTVDACGCSVGQPAVFLFPQGSVASVAIELPPPGGQNSWSVQMFGECFGGFAPCLSCTGGQSVWAWNNLPLPGQPTALTVHLDNGVGCTPSNLRYRFTVP